LMKTMQRSLKIGDRVKVVSTHSWMPGRYGTIKEVEVRAGNPFYVEFESDELGMWHDEDGDPVLRLGENDLILAEDKLSLVAYDKQTRALTLEKRMMDSYGPLIFVFIIASLVVKIGGIRRSTSQVLFCTIPPHTIEMRKEVYPAFTSALWSYCYFV